MTKCTLNFGSTINTVGEYVTHNSKIKGSNPDPRTKRDRMTMCILNLGSSGNTVVEHMSHNPKIKGFNLVPWHRETEDDKAYFKVWQYW